ncbi:MAG TPA: nuclear transport factor 2 family protein [Gemmatimonadales bacterium]|jgi:ketosteroid isomerase-like protein
MLPLTLLAILPASCRFQDRTPGSTRHDEAALQAAAAAFYQALGRADTSALRRLTLPTATALMAPDHGPAVQIPLGALLDVVERREESGGARIARSELHPDGDIATERLVVVAGGGDGRGEYEASDLLTLARRDGTWRVAHAALGSWRIRSAP